MSSTSHLRKILIAAVILVVVGLASVGSYFTFYKPTEPYMVTSIPTGTTVSSVTLTSTTISTTSIQTATTTANTVEQINQSLSRLESTGVELNIRFAKELRKLPDLLNAISAKNIDVRMARAVEDLVRVVLGADGVEQQAIVRMLEEGIPEKRKFCTPLQAWLWVSYDTPDYNPLPNYSLDSLLSEAWLGTTTSNDFNSNRWSYAEAKDRVNSPEIVNWFIFHYLTFDTARASVHPQDDAITYNVRRGVCRHAAYLATEFLTHNGYEAKDVTFSPARNQGQTVSAVTLDDGVWVVVDFRCNSCYLSMQGPFKSYMDVAYYVANSLGYKTTFFIGIETNYEIMERNNDLP